MSFGFQIEKATKNKIWFQMNLSRYMKGIFPLKVMVYAVNHFFSRFLWLPKWKYNAQKKLLFQWKNAIHLLYVWKNIWFLMHKNSSACINDVGLYSCLLLFRQISFESRKKWELFWTWHWNRHIIKTTSNGYEYVPKIAKWWVACFFLVSILYLSFYNDSFSWWNQ